MKKGSIPFKDKIIKDLDSLTVNNFDKFYGIMKKFFAKAYNIKYQFAFGELGVEIAKKEKKKEIREFMEHFLAEVGRVEFTGKKITKDQLENVKKIAKRIVELVEVEVEDTTTETRKIKSKVQKRIEAGFTVFLFLVLLTVVILYFVRINILGLGGVGIIGEHFIQEEVSNETISANAEVVENATNISEGGNMTLNASPPKESSENAS